MYEKAIISEFGLYFTHSFGAIESQLTALVFLSRNVGPNEYFSSSYVLLFFSTIMHGQLFATSRRLIPPRPMSCDIRCTSILSG